MPDRRRKEDASALAAAVDRLYGAPLDQFVALRRELSSALRAAGETSAAREVSGATKPTRTAWALNQVARQKPDLLRVLFETRDRAASAQRGSDAETVRTAVRDYRDQVTEVVRAAREALAAVGIDLGAAQSRRIGETLQAAAAAENEVRQTLLAGRLADDIDDGDALAGLEAGAATSTPLGDERGEGRRAAQRREASERLARQEAAERERRQRERAIEQARHRVASLETQAAEAIALATAAEASARRAAADAAQARRAADQAENLLEQARAEMRTLIG